MMKSLYSKYFQKSRSFLFPILRIPKSSHPPVQTFLSLNDNITEKDMKLTCLFTHANTEAYLKFQDSILLNHNLFYDADINPGSHSIYLFDFKLYADDWNMFLKGKYSKLSSNLKSSVIDYYGTGSAEFPYMDSFLHPDKYFDKYAELLDEKPELLKSVGQLCDVYDPVKEKLLFSTNKFEIVDKRHTFVE